ncbi:hypothetical protein JG687_00019588, partial [Phytophthora cactorum]
QLCKDALEEVENLDFKPIFRKVYSKTLDTCRQQALAPVSGDALAKIHEIGVHRDLPTFETARALLKHRVVQGSVIVALMDNTRLHVYPGCFGEQADRETPVLQRVTVLFFEETLPTLDPMSSYEFHAKCNSLTQHIKRSHTKKGETRAIEEVRMNEGDDEQSSESGEESGETEENEEESEEESEESSEYSGNDSSADEE